MFCQIEKILCFKLDSKYKYKKLNFFSTFFPIFFFVQNVQIQIFFFFFFVKQNYVKFLKCYYIDYNTPGL